MDDSTDGRHPTTPSEAASTTFYRRRKRKTAERHSEHKRRREDFSVERRSSVAAKKLNDEATSPSLAALVTTSPRRSNNGSSIDVSQPNHSGDLESNGLGSTRSLYKSPEGQIQEQDRSVILGPPDVEEGGSQASGSFAAASTSSDSDSVERKVRTIRSHQNEHSKVRQDDELPSESEDDPSSLLGGSQRETTAGLLRRAAEARLATRDVRRQTGLKHLEPQVYNLFSIVDHRGFEPFLPLAWHLDFPFGVDTFFGHSREDTHINSCNFENSNANFRAIKALESLAKLGPAARDRLRVARRRPEPLIGKALRSYMLWSEQDAQHALDDASESKSLPPPLLSIAIDSTEGGTDHERVIQQLSKRMKKNARAWHRYSDTGSSPNSHSKDSSGDADVSLLGSLLGRLFRKQAAPAPAPDERMNTKGRGDTKGYADSHQRDDSLPPFPSSPPSSANQIKAVYGFAVTHLVVAVLYLNIDDVARHNDVVFRKHLMRSRASVNRGDETMDEKDGDSGDSSRDSSDDDSQQGDDDRADNDEDEDNDEDHDDNSRPRGERVLYYVDFGVAGDDVWNAVALAMTVCYCRDLQLRAFASVATVPDVHAVPAVPAKGIEEDTTGQ